MNKVLQPNERKNAVQWYLRGGFTNSHKTGPAKRQKVQWVDTNDLNVLKYLLKIEKILFTQMQGQTGLDVILYVSALHSRLETAIRTHAWERCTPERFMSMTPLELLKLNGEEISFQSLIDLPEEKQPLPSIKDALGLTELRHATLCPKCKSIKHGVDEETTQIRASDEGITALYTCRNPVCRYSWRSG